MVCRGLLRGCSSKTLFHAMSRNRVSPSLREARISLRVCSHLERHGQSAGALSWMSHQQGSEGRTGQHLQSSMFQIMPKAPATFKTRWISRRASTFANLSRVNDLSSDYHRDYPPVKALTSNHSISRSIISLDVLSISLYDLYSVPPFPSAQLFL